MIFKKILSLFPLLCIVACSISSTSFGMAINGPAPVINHGEEIPLDLEILLRDHAAIEQPNLDTELYLAILSNFDCEIIRSLIAQGANPNISGSNGVYLLDVALYKGNRAIIDELKLHKAISTPNSTPLHYAAIFNDCNLANESLLSGCPIMFAASAQ